MCVGSSPWLNLAVRVYLSSPHEPELEDVNVASTLQRLVSGVVAQVVLFVLLEQVTRLHLVTALHQTLQQHRAQNIPPK